MSDLEKVDFHGAQLSGTSAMKAQSRAPPTPRYDSHDRDLEFQAQSENLQGQSVLGQTYGMNPTDQPTHPPRRVSSQRSLRHIRSMNSIHSSVYTRTNTDAPPPIPDQYHPSNKNHNEDRTHHDDNGDDTNAGAEEELAWGPSHPCFPHLNAHVPTSSPEYRATRIIRIRRDWMVIGDLAPTFSNIYPEILDPLLPESEFRFIIQHINSTLVSAYSPFSTSNWLDGLLGFLTGWFWEDIRGTGIKGKLRNLESWIEEWNHRVGSRDGVKLISLRRTGYLSLDVQIPDPQVRIVDEEDDARFEHGGTGAHDYPSVPHDNGNGSETGLGFVNGKMG